MSNIEKIAKIAANDVYNTMKKQAVFDLFELLKGQTAPGQFQKQLEGWNLPGNKTFMGTMAQVGAPLFQAIGGVAGIPGIAAILDLMRGGGNLGMLTRGKDNANATAMLRSSSAADPNAVFNPETLAKSMRVDTSTMAPQAAPGVVPPPPPPKPQTSVGATPVNTNTSTGSLSPTQATQPIKPLGQS